ncbi:addiction module protein [Desulfoplanes sp.]
MQIIPTANMTVEEKIFAMEQLWDELCRTPDSVPPPSWHVKILQARQQKIDQGQAEFRDWDEVKKSLQQSIL